ncbi:unnamed protein product [Mycena citricolor]|uniref:Uncharacterized protein n=1 Tax=Mycena citricolor TaxID=2018698 RepID=A0AAD2HRX2_9AGAR|nr:unnamed protein product [Mycena citricolor]
MPPILNAPGLENRGLDKLTSRRTSGAGEDRAGTVRWGVGLCGVPARAFKQKITSPSRSNALAPLALFARENHAPCMSAPSPCSPRPPSRCSAYTLRRFRVRDRSSAPRLPTARFPLSRSHGFRV